MKYIIKYSIFMVLFVLAQKAVYVCVRVGACYKLWLWFLFHPVSLIRILKTNSIRIVHELYFKRKNWFELRPVVAF